jgi:hypothetical protein
MKKLQLATPGEILLEEFLKPYDITTYQLARDTGMPRTRVSEAGLGSLGDPSSLGRALDSSWHKHFVPCVND